MTKGIIKISKLVNGGVSGCETKLKKSYYICYVLDTQLNKVGSSSELIYFYELQNIIHGHYNNEGVAFFKVSIMFTLIIRLSMK